MNDFRVLIAKIFINQKRRKRSALQHSLDILSNFDMYLCNI